MKIQRRGNQSADVDLRARTEQDAVRIDQVHLAVGIQMPEDLRAVGIEYPVDGNRAR